MFKRRSLSCLVALAVALSLTPRGSAATSSPTEQGSSDQQLYQAYSEFFFLKRDMDFALEMSLRETFLAWLYQGINVEVAARSNEDPFGTLAAITPPELKGLEEASYAFPDSLLDAPLRIRYLAIEEFQKTEFNHKFLQARLIKDRLIRTATAEQKQRMFRYDLESAILAFRDNLYREVILQSDELIDRYGYKDVSDLVFNRAESYLGLQIYDQAQIDYLYVVENSSESWYRLRSLEKLISLAGDKNAIPKAIEYWEKYQVESAGNRDENYWITAERAARYLMVGQFWKNAQAILDSIPTESQLSRTAMLRSADCSLALLELDDAEARYQKFLTPIKGKTFSDEEISDARLKLGYVEYLRGKFDVAFESFNSIEGSGDIAERGQLSAIWCLYRLSAYQQVIDRCNSFLEGYPQSQYFYEVRNLIGFSEEMLGQGDKALDNYRVVMSALDDRQDFYDFNHELGAINTLVGKLQELEAQIFLGGERDLFPEYLKVHKALDKLVDGVRFARALKATPFLKEVLKEQKELYALFKDQTELEEAIYESQDVKLLNEYQNNIGILSDIGSELSAGVKYYMAQKPLAQREQDKLYENQVSDTLIVQLEREWAATQTAMTMVQQYLSNNLGTTDPASLVELAGVETDLTGIQDRILRVRTSLRKFGQESVVSNIDTWSDFAYQRYTYGGLNFDFLYSKEDRIEELDEYIRQVGTLLQDREAVRRDTLTLAAELVPNGKAGDAPYYAPAIPMWGLTMPVSPLAEDATGVDIPQPLQQIETTSPSEELPKESVPDQTTPLLNEDIPQENTPVENSQDSDNKKELPKTETEVQSSDEPSQMTEPTVEPGTEEPILEPNFLDTVTPDSLGKDTTGTPPPEQNGNEEPQNGPSVP